MSVGFELEITGVKPLGYAPGGVKFCCIPYTAKFADLPHAANKKRIFATKDGLVEGMVEMGFTGRPPILELVTAPIFEPPSEWEIQLPPALATLKTVMTTLEGLLNAKALLFNDKRNPLEATWTMKNTALVVTSSVTGISLQVNFSARLSVLGRRIAEGKQALPPELLINPMLNQVPFLSMAQRMGERLIKVCVSTSLNDKHKSMVCLGFAWLVTYVLISETVTTLVDKNNWKQRYAFLPRASLFQVGKALPSAVRHFIFKRWNDIRACIEELSDKDSCWLNMDVERLGERRKLQFTLMTDHITARKDKLSAVEVLIAKVYKEDSFRAILDTVELSLDTKSKCCRVRGMGEQHDITSPVDTKLVPPTQHDYDSDVSLVFEARGAAVSSCESVDEYIGELIKLGRIVDSWDPPPDPQPPRQDQSLMFMSQPPLYDSKKIEKISLLSDQ